MTLKFAENIVVSNELFNNIYFIYIFQNALKSCKQQAKNLADMAKEIEAIERVTSPGDLPSRLEAAENATIDVEKRLAKTVCTIIWELEYWLIIRNKHYLTFYFLEWLTTRVGRGMGEMREKIERRRSLARGDGTNTGSTTKCQEAAQGPTRSKGKDNQRHIHAKDQDIVRGREAKRESSNTPGF